MAPRRAAVLNPVLDEIHGRGPILDVPFAAGVLKISKSHAYALIAAGDFPCRVIRVGNRYRIPTSALLALLEGDPEP